MRDQATELRNLVRQAVEHDIAGEASSPRIIALTGGKGGVGTTTLSIGLSLAMARGGLRSVLVDANLYRADVSALLGIGEEENISDVLAARRDLQEILIDGPQGIQVVAGSWAPTNRNHMTDHSLDRFITQLRSLGPRADVVTIDAGNGAGNMVGRLWSAASDIVLVATCESVAIMDAYATIKSLYKLDHTAPIRLLVNRAPDETAAVDVFNRINLSCKRFLGLSIDYLGWFSQLNAVAFNQSELVLNDDQLAATAEKIASKFNESLKLKRVEV